MTIFSARTWIKQLLLLFIPLVTLLFSSSANANWRIISGVNTIDAMRFDSPESAHSYIRNYRINQLSPTLDYVSDRLFLSTENSDGRYVSWLCLHYKTSPGTYDPQTCYYGNLSGYVTSDFILPVDTQLTPFLDKDKGLPDTNSCVGNPINVATGNKFQQETDLVSGGSEPLVFSRYYNSTDALVDPASGWRHSFLSRVIADANRYGTSTVVVQRPDGQKLAFYRTTKGWLPTWQSDDRLTEINAVYTPVTTQAVTTETGTSTTSTPFIFHNDGWVYTRADGVIETYDHDGRLQKIHFPSGNEQRIDVADDLLTVTDSFGHALRLQMNNEQLVSLTDAAGGQTLYQYNEEGVLISLTHPDGTTRQYHYENSAYPALLTGITDERGVRFASWQYDETGKANRSEHANGVEQATIAYGTDGALTVTNAVGHIQNYQFSRHGSQSKPDSIQGAPCTGLPSGKTSFTYDSNGNLTGKLTAEGQTYSYQYNSRGLETSRTSEEGGQITTQWLPTTALPVKVTEPTLTTDLTYDDHLRVTSLKKTDRTTGAVRQWQFSYNADLNGVPGQLSDIDGPRTDVVDVTHFDYDSQGNLVAVTDAAGNITQYQNYDANGRPQQSVAPNGQITTLRYDYAGRLLQLSDSAGETTLVRDAAGNITSVTKPDGSVIQYQYDDAGRLITTTDSQGNSRSIAYDNLNDVLAETLTDAGGHVHAQQQYLYNEIGYLTGQIDGLGNQSSYTWNRVQDLLSATDPAGHSNSYLVDGFHHVTQHNDPAGKSTLYRYDANGALTKITDPRSKGTIYTRNGFGDVVSLVSPDTGTTTFTYDSAGNMLSSKDAKGQTLTYHYDALNRLTDVSSSVSGESVTTFSYDGTANGKGRLTGISELSGNSVFDYNNEGLLSTAVWVPGNVSFQTRYYYDAAGRLSALTYPSGLVVNYTRDADGQVTGITATTADGVTTQLASDIQYKPFGPMQHIQYGNGLVENRTLNANYQVENITAGAVLNLSYTYGPQGNILAVSDNLNPAYGHVVSYDALDRMLTLSGWYGVYNFEYDATGNRTAITRSGTKDAYTLSTSNNWLTKTGLSATSYSYDAAGNLIKRGTDTFAYDSHSQLASASVNGMTAQYQYNIAGQRVAKNVAGQTTYYIYGQDGQLLAEADAGTGAITRQYIWLGQKPVAYLFGDKGYYVHTDNTDTPQALTDGQQKVVWTTQSYPFGKQQYSGSVAFNLRYPGQYFDEETGLHYNGYRYYDHTTGRYITSDPIGLAGGINTYAYVGSNPLSFVDPLGLDANDISETPGQRSLEQLHGQEHDVISPLVDTDLNNDGIQDVVSPVVLNGGAGKTTSSSCNSLSTLQQGGRYGDLVAYGFHRHHMPSKQASPLSEAEGPSIRMSPEDHRKTASYGGRSNSPQQAYRDKQLSLIKQGKFDDAFLMDVDDIQSKFGHKYDDAILQAMDALP